MTESSKKIGILARFSEPKTQPSLFHYVKENPDPSVFEALDWSFLRHPFRSLREAWKEPRTKASLFHYVETEERKPFSAKEFFSDLFTGFKNPIFIPSMFSDPEGLALERAQGRTRKMEAGMLSIVLHLAVVGLIALVIHLAEAPAAKPNDNVVFVKNDMVTPFERNGEGGGGGGGGKNQPLPPATGRMPDTTRTQMIPPDPDNPKPLMPTVEELLAQVPTVQMPIDIPQDQALAIGDVMAPPNGSMSGGSGDGGGIGTGHGPGVGPGTGPGVGPGSRGGMGGGPGGGIGPGIGPYVAGNGNKPPVAISQPLPNYTEEARKARAEGIVVIQAIIRKNGTVDSFKVLRGLGYGLDESAILTIGSKWRFKPATHNSEPFDTVANIEVAFKLY